MKNKIKLLAKFMTISIDKIKYFFKKNYRNYYDDRSWWDEVGSSQKQ